MVDWSSGMYPACLWWVQLFVGMCNGWLHLALLHHWLLSVNCHLMIVKLGWSGFLVRRAI